MLNQHKLSVYESSYAAFFDSKEYLAKAVAEEPGTTLNSVAIAAGTEGVQAAFDVLMDDGNKFVLVSALNSPALKGWVKEKLEVLLYGKNQRSKPALLSVAHCQ